MLNKLVELENLLAKLVEYVLKHRRGRVFEKWTEDQLYVSFRRGVLDHSLTYFIEEYTGEVMGLCHGAPDFHTKTFFVYNILTTDKKVLPLLLATFDQFYPDFKLTATRRGKYHEYKLASFRRKLQHLID